MDTLGYGRYGLSANPFRDLSSEGLDHIELFHVNQSVDDVLRTVREEVLYKENHAMVAVLGPMGVGKTHRLMVVASEARAAGAFVVLKHITGESRSIASSIIESVLEGARLGAVERALSPPKWYKAVASARKLAAKDYDADRVGDALAGALNANVPSFLLINDLHNLAEAEDADRLLRMLHVVVDNMDHGVLVMVTADPAWFDRTMLKYPSLAQRINKRLLLRTLTDDEAGAVLAKRMLGKRLVEDLEDLYPFTPDAVRMLNTMAAGNPRTLLKLADQVLEYGVGRRSMRITDEIAHTALEAATNETLSVEGLERVPVSSEQEAAMHEGPSADGATRQVSLEEHFSYSSMTPGGDLLEEVVRSVEGEAGVGTQGPGEGPVASADAAGDAPASPVRINCPRCKEAFELELEKGMDSLTCPFCGFQGKLRRQGAA